MELFVIRHAVAVPRGPGLEDAARPLTRRGRTRFERAVRGLDRLGVRFDRLYHSPWLRAVETADALDRLVDGEKVPTARLAQTPEKGLLDELEGDRVGLVGHEPWLGELVALLLLGKRDAGAKLALKKGGVAWLTGDPRPGGASLHACLTPKILRKLARKK